MEETAQESAFDDAENDPDLRLLLWHPARMWDEDVVRRFLKRRNRSPLNEPRCVGITHFKRTGKHACYEFFCMLQLRPQPKPGAEGAPRGFWVPYLDVLSLAEADGIFREKGWEMPDHFAEYSDGEDAWESGGDSNDEDLKERRRRRGTAHRLVRPRPVKGQKRSRSGP